MCTWILWRNVFFERKPNSLEIDFLPVIFFDKSKIKNWFLIGKLLLRLT